MSRAEMTKCDHCGKRVEDHYAERDWLRLTGLASVSITIGRRKDKHAETRFRAVHNGNASALDFCHTKCLLGWLKSIPGPVVSGP